jgi:dihydroorotase
VADGREREKRALIKGGTVLGPDGEQRADVLVEQGAIVDVAPTIDAPRGTRVLDAAGCYVTPGLVDLHTHLREPGGERAETVESGARAAALGGYTAILAMPNTEPTIDSPSVVRDVLALARSALVEVAVAGAITIGRRGEQLAPLGEMAELGVRLFTDDGRGVQNPGLMRRALEYASDLDLILAEHCEDEALAAGGLMHEGAWSSRLGVPGQPALAEEAMVARDLSLVALTGARMHFLHLSTAGSVRLVAAAKADGLPVTAEVTPHHLTLTDARLESYDTRFKVNPPLRTDGDVAALRAGVVAGTIDAIATDHAPHPSELKDEPFADAPPGMTGLETALAVCWGALCGGEEPLLRPAALFALLSARPAAIAGLSDQGGPLVAGRPANICIFDPDEPWTVDPTTGASRSTNSPFIGWALRGRVRHTVADGEVVVEAGKATR